MIMPETAPAKNDIFRAMFNEFFLDQMTNRKNIHNQVKKEQSGFQGLNRYHTASSSLISSVFINLLFVGRLKNPN